jgi:hypothetical protein
MLHFGRRTVEHFEPHQQDHEAAGGLQRRHRNSEGCENWPACKGCHGKNDRGGKRGTQACAQSLSGRHVFRDGEEHRQGLPTGLK